jgi:competence ComEA-like helix-hairpin-helix protein
MTELQPSLRKFVLFFAGAVLFGLGIAAGAFLFSNAEGGGNRFQGAVSETLRDVLGFSGKRQPVLEIDLTENPAPGVEKLAENFVAKRAEKTASEFEATVPRQKKPTLAKTAPESNAAFSEEETEPLLADCNFDSVSAASYKILINEIAWMGTETSANDEWLELKNVSAGEVNLSGWQMLSQDGRIKFRFPNATLKPGGFFLLERTDDDSLPQIKADAIYTGLLPNSGSRLRLFDSLCNLVDEADASGGWAALGGENATKKTLERNAGDLGWHTSSVVGGTPRAENSAGIPRALGDGKTEFSSGGATQAPTPPPPAASASGKININTAGLEELDKITGVGPTIAQRIIDYRNANGPFQKLEDLKKVNGIGDKNFEKMKDEITL